MEDKKEIIEEKDVSVEQKKIEDKREVIDELNDFLKKCMEERDFSNTQGSLAKRFVVSESKICRDLQKLKYYSLGGVIISKALLKKFVADAMITNNEDGKPFLPNKFDYRVFSKFKSYHFRTINSDTSQTIYVIYISIEDSSPANDLLNSMIKKFGKGIAYVGYQSGKIVIHILKHHYFKRIKKLIEREDYIKDDKKIEVSYHKFNYVTGKKIYMIYLRFSDSDVAEELTKHIHETYGGEILNICCNYGYIQIELLSKKYNKQIHDFIRSLTKIGEFKKRVGLPFSNAIIKYMEHKGWIGKNETEVPHYEKLS